jgi:hypothetical protein
VVAPQPLGLLALVVLDRGREELDELLVQQPHARAGEAAVLVDDGCQRPVLHLAHAPDHAARAMLSVVPPLCQSIGQVH